MQANWQAQCFLQLFFKIRIVKLVSSRKPTEFRAGTARMRETVFIIHKKFGEAVPADLKFLH